MSEVDLHYATIAELGSRLRAGQLSSKELTTSILKRIEELDIKLHAYRSLCPELALAQAEASDRERPGLEMPGPLHGIPIAIKDLIDVKGQPCAGGHAFFRDRVPDADATLISRLRAQGAVILGKLNLTEGAMGGYHRDFDIPLNPWKNALWTGSSSSGSGVATAAGLCCAALGSDTGGSIRLPAAACGVVGLKPTYGRVSRDGVLPLAESLDHVGTLARCVHDAAALLEAIAGHDPYDASTSPLPAPRITRGLGKSIRNLRIAFDADYALSDIDTELAQAIEKAKEQFSSLGAEVVEKPFPNLDHTLAAWQTICTAEAVHAHQFTYPANRDAYGPWFREWLDLGSQVSTSEYIQATRQRDEVRGMLQHYFEDVDLLLCPSNAGPPHEVSEDELYGHIPNERKLKFMRFTLPYNYCGYPTLSLPCGMHSVGVPHSLQFVAKPFNEVILCRAGHAYEQENSWHELHPDIPA